MNSWCCINYELVVTSFSTDVTFTLLIFSFLKLFYKIRHIASMNINNIIHFGKGQIVGSFFFSFFHTKFFHKQSKNRNKNFSVFLNFHILLGRQTFLILLYMCNVIMCDVINIINMIISLLSLSVSVAA